MANKLSDVLSVVQGNPQVYRAFVSFLQDLMDRLLNQNLTHNGLVISAGGATTAKTGATASTSIAGGKLVQTAAATVLPVLAGTISQNNFGGWAFLSDSAGTLSSVFLNQASALAGVTFPAIPKGSVILGFILANPTTATFVGGTTALDAANTNVLFISPHGPFAPAEFLQLQT